MNVLTLRDIPRVKAGTAPKLQIKELGEIEQERAYLATRAKDVLGYRGLEADVSGTKVIGEVGKLTETLHTLEIEVLDASTCLRYMVEESARRTLEDLSNRRSMTQFVSGYYTPAKWEHSSLSEYEQAIPEFVLDKAIRIKEALPSVGFQVLHLSDPKADPFLVAINDKEIYFVEAWDEPRFEGRASR